MNRILLNPYQNVDVTGKYATGLQQGLSIAQQRQGLLAQQEEQARQQQARQLAGQFYETPQDEQLGLISQSYGLDPQTAQGLMGVYKQQQMQQQVESQAQLAEQQRELQIGGRLANSVITADHQQKPLIYKASLKKAEELGLDTSDFPPEYSPEVEPMLQALVSQSGLVRETAGHQKSYTKIGQARQDLQAGRITQNEFDQIIESETREKGPITKVDIAGFGQPEFEKEMGKLAAKRIDANIVKAEKSREQLSRLEDFTEAVSDPDVYVGAGAGAIQKMKVIASSVGIDVKGLSQEAIVESLSNRMAKEARTPGEGTMSDSDLKFLKESVPRKNLTREQNIALAKILEDEYRRSLEMYTFENNYIEESGTYVGLEKAKRKFIKENPLFSKEEKEEYKNIFKGKTNKQEYSEGITITNANGDKMILRGGKWQKL